MARLLGADLGEVQDHRRASSPRPLCVTAEESARERWLLYFAAVCATAELVGVAPPRLIGAGGDHVPTSCGCVTFVGSSMASLVHCRRWTRSILDRAWLAGSRICPIG